MDETTMLIIQLVVSIVSWILRGVSHYKIFKMFGYNKAWLGWVPLGHYYGLAELAGPTAMEVALGKLGQRIPFLLFKLWWVALLPVLFIEFSFSNLLSMVLPFVFAGSCYTVIYAAMDGKTIAETKLQGLVSGYIDIIAVYKFLSCKQIIGYLPDEDPLDDDYYQQEYSDDGYM